MKKYLLVLSVLALAGCGGGATAASSASGTPTSPPPADAGRPFAPAVSGRIAAISGKTLQVQSSTSQTAVTYSSSTRFTDTVAAKPSDVVVGLCAQVRSTPAAGGGGSAPTAPPTTVTATTVSLSTPVNGTCSRGGGAGGGRRFGGGGAPGGTPPSGFPGGRRGFGGGAFGTVTAVQGSTFTVASTRRGQGGTPTTLDVVVTTNASTTFTRSAPATAAALRVGLCLTARGQADSTGVVAATQIALRPDDGTCSGGFSGGGQGV